MSENFVYDVLAHISVHDVVALNIYALDEKDYSHEHLAECYVLERFSCIRDDQNAM